MRRLVAALVLATFVLALAGCGGGGEAEAPATTPAPAAAPTPPPVAVPAASGPDLSAEPVSDSWDKFPTLHGAQPEIVKELLESKQPMLLLFFDSDQTDSADQRKAVAAVMKKYRGLIDLVSYDVSKGLEKTTLDSADTAEFSNLTGQLGVRYTPYIVIVNADGYITWRARGIVDAKLIEKAVLRATK